MNTETLEAARNVALRFLGYSARSRSEIKKRLLKAGYEEEIIQTVLSEMEARGWVNDEQFAQDWVTDRADRKGYGRGRLATELRQKGVDRENVDAALETVDDDSELMRALAVARKKWPPETLAELDGDAKQAEKRRMIGFLQRRGFSFGIIGQVWASLMHQDE